MAETGRDAAGRACSSQLHRREREGVPTACGSPRSNGVPARGVDLAAARRRGWRDDGGQLTRGRFRRAEASSASKTLQAPVVLSC